MVFDYFYQFNIIFHAWQAKIVKVVITDEFSYLVQPESSEWNSLISYMANGNEMSNPQCVCFCCRRDNDHAEEIEEHFYCLSLNSPENPLSD